MTRIDDINDVPSHLTREEKDLLLKDLCARLPFNVRMYDIDVTMPKIDLWLRGLTYEGSVMVGDDGRGLECSSVGAYLPYLFSLSSMTEEQKYDFYCRFVENQIDFDDFKEFYLDGGMWHKLLTSLDDFGSIIDWFHKNHFDYRGLIPMGLAIDATGLNIY